MQRECSFCCNQQARDQVNVQKEVEDKAVKAVAFKREKEKIANDKEQTFRFFFLQFTHLFLELLVKVRHIIWPNLRKHEAS